MAKPREKTITVTVLGAGVTGLSVAHELADRGFRVQVIEKETQSPHRAKGGWDPDGPDVDVGGIARTQWAIDPQNVLGSAGFAIPSTDAEHYGAKEATQLHEADPSSAEIHIAFTDASELLKASGQLDVLALLPEAKRGGKGSFVLSVGPHRGDASVTKLVAKVTNQLEARGYERIAPRAARLPEGRGEPGTITVWLTGIGERNDTAFVPSLITDGPTLEALVDPGVKEPQAPVDKAVRKTDDRTLAFESRIGSLGQGSDPGAQSMSRAEIIARSQDAKFHAGEPKPTDPPWGLKFFEGVAPESLRILGRAIAVTIDRSEARSRVLNHRGRQHRLFPGEHGWRFFPGFYRHLFSTMSRTPIHDESDNVFTERTMLDNLRGVEWQVIADPTRRQPAAFRRRLEANPLIFRQQYYALRRQLGYRPSDVLRFGLRMLRYMTSSSERRERYYEDLSWFDFLTLRELASAPKSRPSKNSPPTSASLDGKPPEEPERLRYGRRFLRAIKHSPRALVAMQADYTDTRTQGNISVQLAMSQIGLHERDDSTLPGPTSRAWFDHWREYLQTQGVRFYRGTVESIGITEQNKIDLKIAWPDKGQTQGPEGFEPRSPSASDGSSVHSISSASDGSSVHYVVSALDLVALAEVLHKGSDGSGRFADFERIRDLLPGRSAEMAHRAEPRPADEHLQVLTGIQFYFRQRLNFADGHIYFPDSPWGLSAVSQPQYWQAGLNTLAYGRPGQRDAQRRGAGVPDSGVYGALSVDIGNWAAIDGKNPEYGPDARRKYEDLDPSKMEAGKLAGEVWRQIIRGYGEGARSPGAVPSPVAYHIDRYLKFGENGLPEQFLAPFMVNLVGRWQERPLGEPVAPGAPRRPARVPGHGREHPMKRPMTQAQKEADDSDFKYWVHDRGGYRVYNDGLVLAGPHMRTLTRMNTMEACNESARHAVNAILDHLSKGLLPKEAARAGAAVRSPDFMPTPYGDYCRIWNPEDHEIPELELLRRIDAKLLPPVDPGDWDADDRHEKAPDPVRAPHIFDLLGIDDLARLVETDDDAEAVFRLIEGVIDEVQLAQPEEARASFAAWPFGPEVDFASSTSLQAANIFIGRLVRMVRDALSQLGRPAKG